MRLTHNQILKALQNTLRQPVNRSPAIYAALRNEKPAGAGGLLNVLADNITRVTHE